MTECPDGRIKLVKIFKEEEDMKKIIVYLNQFFGQIGGEEFASTKPMLKKEKVGVAAAIDTQIKNGEVEHTLICGDDFMNEHTEEALAQIDSLLEGIEFDMLIAGPAFFAGRYGTNCGRICKHIQERYQKTAVTSMYEENPGVELFRKEVYILRGGDAASAMQKDMPKLSRFADKILGGEKILWAQEEGYFPRGKRLQVTTGETADNRAFDMLMRKLAGKPFVTEMPIKMPDKVAVAPPVTDPAHTRFAFVTTSGIVPIGNPDKIQTGSATRFGRYAFPEEGVLKEGEWESIHGGYDHTYANADPMTHVPLDVFSKMLKEEKIGYLHPFFYSTTGNHTNESNSKRMAQEIVEYLKEDNIQAVILNSA